MALQKTLSLLLLLLLTLLGLGLVQPSYGESRYDKFKRQHVDSSGKGGNSSYCNDMMQRRKMMTGSTCKEFNTFIHADIGTIEKICKTPKIRCKNGKKNCHKGRVRVTDCSLTERSQGNCIYEGRSIKRRIVIACQGKLPVHFDR